MDFPSCVCGAALLQERFIARAWMSVASESPTCSASAGAQPTRRQAASKMSGLGFSLQPSSSCSPPTRIMGNKSCRAEPQRPQRWEVRGIGRVGERQKRTSQLHADSLARCTSGWPLVMITVACAAPQWLGGRRPLGGGGASERRAMHGRDAVAKGGTPQSGAEARRPAPGRPDPTGSGPAACCRSRPAAAPEGEARPGVIESNRILCNDNQQVPRRPRLQLRGQPLRQRGARRRGLSQRRAPVAGAPFRDQDLPVG